MVGGQARTKGLLGDEAVQVEIVNFRRSPFASVRLSMHTLGRGTGGWLCLSQHTTTLSFALI